MLKDPRTLLGSYFKYDASNDVWRCCRHPDENEVAEALFSYILCFRSVQQIKNHYDTVKCAYCDENIPKETDRCEMCDMVKDVKIENKELKEEIEKKIVDKVVDSENKAGSNNDENSELSRNDTQKPLKIKNNKDQSSMIEKNSEMKIINDKWKCGRCECMNEYTFINCEACEGLYKDGKWNCGKCTLENSCVNNKCEACGETNVNIIDTVISVNDDDKFDSFKKENININAIDKVKNEQFDFVKKYLKEFEVNSKEIKENASNDKWKCGECEYMNEYLCVICKICEGLYKDGKWNCGSCTLENSCVNERCGACGEKNINLKNKKRVKDEMEDLTKNENDRNEFTINNKVIKDKTANDKWNCGKCDCLNEYPCDKCKVWGGLYKNGNWNCGSCTLENSCDRFKCRECGENKVYIKSEKRENDEKNDFTKNENEINKFRINTIEIKENTLNDKWKCGKCEYLNEYTFINCKVCEGLYKDGKWICGKCKIVNDCADNKCVTCGVKNINIEIKNKLNDYEMLLLKYQSDKDDELWLDNDQWRCGRCGVLQLYNFTVCNVCGGSRIEYGLWKCSQCTILNKCEDEKCNVCKTFNNLLKEPSKSFIEKTKDFVMKPFQRSNNKDHSEDWQCTYDNCETLNNIDSQYCKQCYLIKDHDLSRGAAIKWKKKDVESVIWICFKCLTFNNIEKIVCKKKKCRYPRYEEKGYI